MDKKIFMVLALGMIGSLLVTLLFSSGAVTQEKGPIQYKVIKTQDFIKAVNPKPSERMRVQFLTPKEAKNINGHLTTLPPATPGEKPQYHYHTHREGIIQILSGDATEWVEGKPIPLKPGDVIFIPPNIKHTLMNNSTTQDVRYMEFFSPIPRDTVQVKD
jgi:quercetin dioxygenase-like cupin family protein